jgi:hypothetical protein
MRLALTRKPVPILDLAGALGNSDAAASTISLPLSLPRAPLDCADEAANVPAAAGRRMLVRAPRYRSLFRLSELGAGLNAFAGAILRPTNGGASGAGGTAAPPSTPIKRESSAKPVCVPVTVDLDDDEFALSPAEERDMEARMARIAAEASRHAREMDVLYASLGGAELGVRTRAGAVSLFWFGNERR